MRFALRTTAENLVADPGVPLRLTSYALLKLFVRPMLDQLGKNSLAKVYGPLSLPDKNRHFPFPSNLKSFPTPIAVSSSWTMDCRREPTFLRTLVVSSKAQGIPELCTASRWIAGRWPSGSPEAGKFSRAVELFYLEFVRQFIEKKDVRIGLGLALRKSVGEANRGSL